MTEVYSFVIAAIMAGVVFVSKEMIVRLIQQHYSNLSKSQVTRSFYALLVATFLLSFVVVEVGSTAGVEEEPEKEIVESPKSDAEVIAGAVEPFVDKAIENRDRKKREDSVQVANREKKWVFQIGTPRTKSEALKLCNSLQTLEGICLFKEGRKSYRVILFETNSTEASLKANRSLLQETLNIREDITVVDLTSFCSRKEAVFLTESVEGEYGLVKCYQCKNE